MGEIGIAAVSTTPFSLCDCWRKMFFQWLIIIGVWREDSILYLLFTMIRHALLSAVRPRNFDQVCSSPDNSTAITASINKIVSYRKLACNGLMIFQT